MPSSGLTAEERGVIARSRIGGRAGSGRLVSRGALEPAAEQAAYPAGVSTKTLGLLGQIDALMKAEPQPPKWALLRVLSLLEEERERS